MNIIQFNMKRAILRINTLSKIEVFTSLRKLDDKYSEIERFSENIDTYLTRKKTDYVSADYTIRRVFINET